MAYILPKHTSRRAFLLLSATAALSGCGLRLGSPEDRMQAEAEESSRGRIAAVLASINDDNHEEERAKLTAAIGPPWTSDSSGIPEIPPEHTFTSAMYTIVDLVLRDIHTLGGPQTAIIVDVAVGASNLLPKRKPAQRRFAQLPAQGYPDFADRKPYSPGDDADPLHEFAAAAFKASYGYTKVALAMKPDSGERKAAAARVEALANAASDANMLLKQGDREEAANRPAWSLPQTPSDPGSAKQLAQQLEDTVAAALFRVFEDPAAVPLAGRELKASADARIGFGGRQLLRYEGEAQ